MKINDLYPVAVIDVGSNSVRLMFSNGKTKQKSLITTRLGEGLSLNNELQKTNMEKTLNAIGVFYKKAIEQNAKNIYCFGTAACRNAKNGKDFVELVKDKLKIDIDVISGEEEAEIALLGALGQNDGGVIDVGGNSSEICVRKNSQIIYKRSLNVGAVRVFDMFKGDKVALNGFLQEAMKEYKEVPKTCFKTVGGTSSTLAIIDLKLKEYNERIIDKHFISTKRLEEISNELFSLTPSEIVKKYNINEKRAEIIAGGSLIILNIAKYLSLEGIEVCETDNLDGYLLRRIYE